MGHTSSTALRLANVISHTKKLRLEFKISLVCRWFAALGSYQREPWLVNLVDKLLVGGDSAADVIRLLDTDQYPFKLHPPRLIRATLYHYDFTRYNNTWVQLKGIDAKQHILNSTSEIADQPWWTRSEVGVYLPSLEADNPSVVDFLHGAGLKVRHQQTRSSTYEDCLHIMPTLDLLFINKMKPLICGSLLIRAMYNNITGA